VTKKTGTWYEGWDVCQAEFPGSEFAVPVNGWQNEKLKAANLQKVDLWLNYNDIRVEGQWMINKPPVVNITGPQTVEEGSHLPLGVPFQVTVEDEDFENINIQQPGCGEHGIFTLSDHGKKMNVWCRFPEGPATSTLSMVVTDSLGLTSRATYDVTVKNVAPRMTGPPILNTSITSESGSVTLSGSFYDPGLLDSHTVAIDWRDGTSEEINLQPGVGSFSITHQILDDNPTATPSDLVSISVIVKDDDGDSDNSAVTALVNNVAPVASMNVTGTVGLAEERLPIVPGYVAIMAAGSFTDIGTKDTHSTNINWGDAGPLALALSGKHFYVAPGIYTITFTVADDDGGVGIKTSQVKVVSAQTALSIASNALLQLLSQSGLSPGVREAINRALDDLRGNSGGRAGNGASDQLSKGNRNSALEKIAHALKELSSAGTGPELMSIRMLLTLTAKGIAVEAITKAEALPTPPNNLQKIREAKALVAAGDALLFNGSFWGAADKYQEAARKL